MSYEKWFLTSTKIMVGLKKYTQIIHNWDKFNSIFYEKIHFKQRPYLQIRRDIRAGNKKFLSDSKLGSISYDIIFWK